MMKLGNVCIMSPIITVLAISLLIGGCSFLQQQVEMVESHLGNEGPAFQEGMTPSSLGWGPDDEAYPDRFVVYPQDGSELVWVPPGSFPMGSTEEQIEELLRPSSGAARQLNESLVADEIPQRQVEITSGFWIGKHEVTNAQYRSFCEATRREFPSFSNRGDDHPVMIVSWDDAVAYAEHYGLNLPTEAQWEYAARGPQGPTYPWGNEWDGGNCAEMRTEITFPVGSFPEGASWVGALDMAGNVWEWCADWYDEDYYAGAPSTDPRGPAGGKSRVLRGGSWYDISLFCRSAYRSGFVPPNRASLGFRVARS